jgi:hypothetical protein
MIFKMDNYIEFEMTTPLTYTSFVKAKVLCGMSIVLAQSEWITDKDHMYKIQANMIEDIPIFLCNPDIANTIKELCKAGNVEVIDYKDYLEGKIGKK